MNGNSQGRPLEMSMNSNLCAAEQTAFTMAPAGVRAEDASLPHGWWIVPAMLSGIGCWVMIARLLIG
ncbi:hypothetical protein [Roseicitreum antarcticum]|uniref:Uncharacterized protein n=1 Tax=Roseicitreum antarcticum TaxID=564137 RepID=A0A1H3BL03_9RHOB|nr:hypothetical protein [Roseicitreum antarcticum]SDX42587.1 hypothetical protein SAMN04488238_10894 [Roseicitreum antarcticum]